MKNVNCGKTFAAKHHLKRHLQMVHNNLSSNKLDCPKCFKGFAHISNLHRHVRKCFLGGWFVVFGLNDPLRQYFSLYRVVSHREGEREEKG